MTIDEAIESLKYDFEIDMYIHDISTQLAEWLKELKTIKEMDLDIPQHFTKEQSEWIKSYCIQRNKEFYNKAIDDFIEMIIDCIDEEFMCQFKHFPAITMREIAEQLKAGGVDE